MSRKQPWAVDNLNNIYWPQFDSMPPMVRVMRHRLTRRTREVYRHVRRQVMWDANGERG
jgi:hypothetical protein